MASTIYPLNDTTELVEFFKPQGLYLKPLARLNITVQLPTLKEPGKSISNWDLMERLKKMVRPHQFCSIKVIKGTLEIVRFEAEVESRQSLQDIISLLDNSTVKIIGFYEPLKVHAGEAKLNFPTKHDWDSYFRDAPNMNELKAGERPDTLYLKGVPCKWFVDKRYKAKESAERNEPSEMILRRVFETFGEIRCVDIPMTDPYLREYNRSGGGMNTFSFSPDVTFDCYVQYTEYIGFVKAMDALRGMKLVYFDDDEKASACSFQVEFDKSKHLSDKNIRKRRLERERLMQLQQDREEKARREKEEQERAKEEQKKLAELTRVKQEEEKLTRRRDREEKRRLKQMERKQKLEDERLDRKIRMEERKLCLAQRRLESMRLLADIFQRVGIKRQKLEVERKLKELEDAKRKQADEEAFLQREEQKRRERLLVHREEQLRNKVYQKWRTNQEHRQDVKRELYRDEIKEGGYVMRSSAIRAGHRQFRGQNRFFPYNPRGRFQRFRGGGRGYFRGRGEYSNHYDHHRPSYSRDD